MVIATKIGGESNPGGKIPIRPAQRPEQLRASVEKNLRTLGVDHLDIVNLRRMDVGPGLKAEDDQVVISTINYRSWSLWARQEKSGRSG